MKAVLSRPLFFFCAVFLLISAGAAAVPSAAAGVGAIALGILAVPAAVLALVKKKTLLRFAALFSIAASLACALSFFAFGVRLGGAEKFDGKTENGTVTVTDTRYSSENYGVYRASFTGADAGFDVVLTSSDGGLVPGDVLEGSFTFSKLEDGGAYNERSSYLPDGIFMEAEEAEAEYSRHDNSFSLSKLLHSMRRTINSRFAGSLSRSAAGLSAALLTGERNGVTDTLKRDFSRLGVSHLLAISGLHLSVLLFILVKILDAAGAGRVSRGIVSIVFIVFFAALTGFSVSVLRASFMHIVAIGAGLFGKKSDPLTALGVAGAVIVALNPFAVLDTALWLSLLSAYACVAGTVREKAPALQEKRRSFPVRAGRKIWSSIKLTAYITVCTLPVTWLTFGEVSVVSPLSNLVFIPAITVYLWASLIFALAASAGIPAAGIARFIDGFESLISRAAGTFSGVKGIVRSSRGVAAEAVVFVIFVLALALPLLSGKAKRARFALYAAVLALAAIVGTGVILGSGTSDALYVLGKSSDGIVLRDGNTYFLIDDSSGSVSFARRMLHEAREEGACEIETYVLTHTHARHASAVRKLTGIATVRCVAVPEPKTDDEKNAVAAIGEICGEHGVTLIEYSAPDGGTVPLGSAVFTPLGGYTPARMTHLVTSFSVTGKDISVLYLSPSSADRSKRELDAEATADCVIFGAHPRARTPSDVPENAVVITAPEANGEGLSGVTFPTRDRDGYATYKIPSGNKKTPGSP
ncbi:MAG: ComEC/Rec2 family competence protein [Clostridia bacterium]|nr:ComEC/Rec2 family competence protein [Clostridia bacterium]